MRYNFGEYSALPHDGFKTHPDGRLIPCGGGGFLGLGGAPSAPAPPDYRAAARETAAGNLEASRAALAGSLISQETPYGSLTYKKTGEDQYGNPTYTATTALSDEGRNILAQQQRISQELAAPQSRALGYINEQLGSKFAPNLPSVGINPGEDVAQATMRQLAPTIAADREQLEQTLANQGIAPGSKAYERAMERQGAREAQLRDQAIVGGFQTGLAANQAAFNQAAYARNEPVNLLASLRSGSQVTNPSFVNTPQQSVTQGADLLGAAQAGYNAQLGDFNAKQAAQQSLNKGLFQLAGAGIGAFCDIYLKENITHVDEWNEFPVYEFNYIDRERFGDERFVGIMAQDVERIHPECVGVIDGDKYINFTLLGAHYG